MLKQVSLIVGAVILAIGVMFLFFGGTWEGVRFGLEILGAVWILQTAYSVLVKDDKKKQEVEEVKKISDKYFTS